MNKPDNDKAIRDRAYEIWEREGYPTGREHEHWAEAARDIEESGKAGEKPELVRKAAEAPKEWRPRVLAPVAGSVQRQGRSAAAASLAAMPAKSPSRSMTF